MWITRRPWNKFEGDGVSIYGRRHHRQSTRRGPRLAYTIKVGPSEPGAGPAGSLGAGILPERAISRGRKSGPATPYEVVAHLHLADASPSENGGL